MTLTWRLAPDGTDLLLESPDRATVRYGPMFLGNLGYMCT